MMLHGLLAVIAAITSPETSFAVLLAYMSLVHIPAHFARVAKEPHGEVAITAALLGTAFLTDRPLWKGVVKVDHLAQRLVISHVVCNLSQQLEGTHWPVLLALERGPF